MAIETARLEHVRRRYSYGDWFGKGRLDIPTKTGRVDLELLSLPGWRLQHVDVAEEAPSRRASQSIWHRDTEGKDEALSIDVYEFASRQDAHDFLLELLDQFQSPIIERLTKDAPGDVAFAQPGEHAVVYAVASLVIVLRNAGRQLVPVTGLARTVQEQLVPPPAAR